MKDVFETIEIKNNEGVENDDISYHMIKKRFLID